MAVKLSRYAEIHDRCVISYRGPCLEYAVLLRALRPAIERALGIQVYLSCRDEASRWLGNDRVVPAAELQGRRQEFAFVLELAGDGRRHPVEVLMDESAIPIAIEVPEPPASKRCLIVPVGNQPLSERQTARACELARQEGYEVEFGDDLEGVGWVIGTECPLLFEAACRGIRTTLAVGGLGAYLYSRMFNRGKLEIF